MPQEEENLSPSEALALIEATMKRHWQEKLSAALEVLREVVNRPHQQHRPRQQGTAEGEAPGPAKPPPPSRPGRTSA